MIHMRPYNSFEEKNVKFLVDHQIEFTTIQITETGLKKSILDATAPVREYFKEKGVHDYEKQPQGTDHKRVIKTLILTDSSVYPTRTSVYRPTTKKGDPRLWVNKVAEIDFLHADDIFILIWHSQTLYAVNLSTTDIPRLCNSSIDTPIRDLISEISKNKVTVAIELLDLIKGRLSDWVRSEVNDDTGVGRTIETALGISMNASKQPDYKGIEIKSHRKKAKVRNTLFTQAPQWDISKLKNAREIVEKYGYYKDGHAKTLQVTLSATGPNKQGLGLIVKTDLDLLEADEFCLVEAENNYSKKLHDVVAWNLSKLHERLRTKHQETFWIDVATKYEKGQEWFKCIEIEHTKNPIVPQFDILLDQGQIQVDFLLCRPSGNGDTFGFKIKQKARKLLFPESETYRLS